MYKEFVDYVWGFYGNDGIYESFFRGNPITKSYLVKVIERYAVINPNFQGDSADRETIREIMALERGVYGGMYIDHLRMASHGLPVKFKN